MKRQAWNPTTKAIKVILVPGPSVNNGSKLMPGQITRISFDKTLKAFRVVIIT